MTNEEKLTALYDKMTAEQDTYRDWLKKQSPKEILHHTYEYTVREDIVMAMEDLKLTDLFANQVHRQEKELSKDRPSVLTQLQKKPPARHTQKKKQEPER